MKEKEKILTQVPDNRKEITELTETELKELEKVANQYGRDSFEYHKYLMHFRNSRGCASYRILRLHPQEFP